MIGLIMPSENLKISDLGEKKLIKRLLKRSRQFPFKSNFFDELSHESRSDDAALIDFGENYLVATSDLLIKSSHFPKGMSPRQIGKKIVTVNVSDLAAMGAKPLGIIVSMALPPDLPLSDFDEIIEGILQASEQYNLNLIGGDTNESSELILSGTCLGIIDKEKVMMKSGTCSGDILAVTGPLGLAAAGFEILFDNEVKLKDLNPDYKDLALKHALEGEAQLEKGLSLAESGVVTSATDITDGLLSEIGELIDASADKVGVTLYENLIPIPAVVFEVANLMGKNPFEMALSYGEDFELLLTIREDKFKEIKDKFSLHKIGYVTVSGQIQMINKKGETNILTPKGYEHLKNPGK